MLPTESDLWDVAVIGAGPSGLLAAAELQRLGLEVLVLEKRPHSAPGSRAIGVHSPVLAALEASGITDRLLSDAVRIRRGIARARERDLGVVDFSALRIRFPFVASVPQAVTEAAIAASAPSPLRGAEVLLLETMLDRVRIMARVDGDDRAFFARVAVVATGGSGRQLVSQLAGLRSKAYRDCFLMTDVAVAPTQPEDAAIITLDREGVLESLPLDSGGRRLVAWHAPSGRGTSGHTTDAAIMRRQLRHAVAVRTGDEELAGRIESVTRFGIRRITSPRMRWGRILAIGDAAHEISPIGGQGMNLGLLDAVTLAPALLKWLSGDRSEKALQRWERMRVASAKTAARIAELNTCIGRPSTDPRFGFVTGAVRAALRSPLVAEAAKAYSMGFDRHA